MIDTNNLGIAAGQTSTNKSSNRIKNVIPEVDIELVGDIIQ